jgi:hypothetical protein
MNRLLSVILLLLPLVACAQDRKVIVVEPNGASQEFVPKTTTPPPVVVEPPPVVVEPPPVVAPPPVVEPPPTPIPPAAPTGLTAAPTLGGARLSWADNANDENRFWLERDDGTGYKQIGDIPADSTSFDDTGLDPALTYAYRVRAVKTGVGTSSYSNSVNVKALPPPTGIQQYAEVGGMPAQFTKLNPGDLSNADGIHVLADGTYTLSALTFKNGVKLYAQNKGGAVIKIPAGKQVVGGKDVLLAGVVFTDGGVAKSTDGKQAMVITGDRWKQHTVRVTKAVGVGMLLKGTGLVTYFNEYHNNGTSGRMVMSRGVDQKPGSGCSEYYPKFHDNNNGGKPSDAANKGTQTSEYYSVGAEYYNEYDGAQWWDISCWNIVMDQPYIHDIKTSREWFRAVGVRFELNNYGTYYSGIYKGRIENVEGSALAVNESGHIQMADTTIGKCKYWLEVRQQTRSDDPGDGGLTGPWPKGSSNRQGPGRPGAPAGTLGWFVFDIDLSRNNILPGAGPADYSGSEGDIDPKTSSITQARNKIVFKDNKWPAGKTEADMVKIKK